MIKSFDALIEKAKTMTEKKTVAVVCAHDAHTLEAVVQAEKEGVVQGLLIGDVEKIKVLLKEMSYDKPDEMMIAAESDREAAEKAVALIREKSADFIMKGKIQTADLLKAVVDKEKGLRTGRVMSHLAFNQLSNYHKLIVISDGGMMMYPDLEEKKQIVQNGVDILRAMGVEMPKVAVLTAVEKVNPKMPETVDAAALKAMNQNGELENCIVEGPISYDLTMNAESAVIKGFESPVCGDADLLIVPNITVGNILGKALVYSAESKMAGMIVGAQVPIVLTSRGATSEEKYLSLVLCASAV
ncbi:MAG: bifunctional enoyl-CoA hydratase/phosphate acetyltransferase [Clostridia bacterium]|nr:bifunctional enoyl-CoA hydratase/phosphate acetyltransferase [Clostridia bacterium]